MNQRLWISSGSEFENQIGYSRAVADGDYIFVSGTTGFDYKTMAISDDIVEQTEACFRNIRDALEQLDSSVDEIVRVRYFLPNRADFESCWPVLKKYLHRAKPAATMLVTGLYDERMKIEIEVTARRRGARIE